MTFDEDLIEDVQQQALPGVHFGREEVEKALVAALDRMWLGPWSAGTAVELAADQALRARLPKPEPKPLGFWGSLAARLGLT